jgi:hypothetical protein
LAFSHRAIDPPYNLPLKYTEGFLIGHRHT